MDRNKAIQIIEGLFPADSEYPDTAEIGKKLLTQAKTKSWRDEPIDVLIRYANLCLQEEQRQFANIK